jgi:hypothetical protein
MYRLDLSVRFYSLPVAGKRKKMNDNDKDHSDSSEKNCESGSVDDKDVETTTGNKNHQQPEKRLKYRERDRNLMLKKKRKMNYSPDAVQLPESFEGEDLVNIVNNRDDSKKFYRIFPLTCGLIVRLRSGLHRLYRRSEYRFVRNIAEQANQFYHLVSYMTREYERLATEWTPEKLWLSADELAEKGRMISNPLFVDFVVQPLYPLHPVTNQLQFHADFIEEINQEHSSLQRPEGTFTLPETEMEQIKQLAALPRVQCPKCSAYRQIYCGSCGNPMESALSLLPSPRIKLPFEILLLLHYQESLIKCTGVHASVLCEENTLSYWPWLKSPEDWQKVVEKLDAENDVLLFPFPTAIPADQFDWQRIGRTPLADEKKTTEEENFPKQGEEDHSTNTKPWRLVVLEASWGYGKTMAQQILDHRKAKNLPPMKSVILTNITGEYWRFQSEGHSAVSTIEAVAHTAKAAGMNEKDFNDLLILFRLQKYRVIKHTFEEGGKVPRAMEVAGDGTHSWKNVFVIAEERSEEQK